jgi:hypothetical protein
VSDARGGCQCRLCIVVTRSQPWTLERSSAAARIAKRKFIGTVASFCVLGFRRCRKSELWEGSNGDGCRSKGQHFNSFQICLIQDCFMCDQANDSLVFARNEGTEISPAATFNLLIPFPEPATSTPARCSGGGSRAQAERNCLSGGAGAVG